MALGRDDGSRGGSREGRVPARSRAWVRTTGVGECVGEVVGRAACDLVQSCGASRERVMVREGAERLCGASRVRGERGCVLGVCVASSKCRCACMWKSRDSCTAVAHACWSTQWLGVVCGCGWHRQANRCPQTSRPRVVRLCASLPPSQPASQAGRWGTWQPTQCTVVMHCLPLRSDLDPRHGIPQGVGDV